MDHLLEAIAGFPPEWRVFFLSMLPVTELRVAIPLGLAWGIDPVRNYLFCVAGNLLPVGPLLWSLRGILRILSRWGLLARILERIVFSAERKGRQLGKWTLGGLVLFVSIPAPGTGAWTGSLIAHLLGTRRLPAFLAITLGVLVVGLLMTLVSLGVFTLTRGNTALAVLLLAGLFCLLYSWRRRRSSSVKADPD